MSAMATPKKCQVKIVKSSFKNVWTLKKKSFLKNEKKESFLPEVLKLFSVLRPVCFSVSAAKRKEHRLFAKEILQLRQFSDKFVSG